MRDINLNFFESKKEINNNKLYRYYSIYYPEY